MASQPQRPGAESELDDEIRRVLDERLNATDEPAMGAKEFLAGLQERLRNKEPAPR